MADEASVQLAAMNAQLSTPAPALPTAATTGSEDKAITLEVCDPINNLI
jgi:hypothetical protein